MRYVVGLLFSEDRRHVVLILKDRPSWQAGLFNAPGGKIEPKDKGEAEACRREFNEETGVDIDSWQPVVILGSEKFEVHFFAAFSDAAYSARTMESEEVFVVPVENVFNPKNGRSTVPGLPTQIMIALDQSGIVKPVMIAAKLKGEG